MNKGTSCCVTATRMDAGVSSDLWDKDCPALPLQSFSSRSMCVLHPACVSRLVLRCAVISRAGRLALQLSLASRLEALLVCRCWCCLPVVVGPVAGFAPSHAAATSLRVAPRDGAGRDGPCSTSHRFLVTFTESHTKPQRG